MASLGGDAGVRHVRDRDERAGDAMPMAPSGVSSANYSHHVRSRDVDRGEGRTSLALTTTPNPSQTTRSFSFAPWSRAVAPGAGTATGTVSFYENGTLLGSATLVNGVATLNKASRRARIR